MSQFNLASLQAGMSIDELADEVAKLTKTLNHVLYHLDSINVKRLYTEETYIGSTLGETVISGPTLQMFDKQATPVMRLQMGYLASASDFVFQMFNKTGAQMISLDTSGNYVFAGGTIRTAPTGQSRIELTGNSLKTYYNDGTNDYLNGIAWGIGSGARYGDVSFYDTGVETMRFYNALAGGGWDIYAPTGVLGLGYGGKYTAAFGHWDFSGKQSIAGLSTAPSSTGPGGTDSHVHSILALTVH